MIQIHPCYKFSQHNVMKFDLTFPGRKKLIIIGVIVLLVVIGIIVVIVRSRSKYMFPDASDTSAGGGSTLVNAIAACTTKYRAALQQSLTDSTPPKAQCIQDAVNNYFTAKCPFVFTPGTAPTVGTNGQAAVTAYNTFMGIGLAAGTTGDAAKVTGDNSYINLVSAPTPANGVLTNWVLGARKADLTGPTRKYIAAACTGFYKPADSTVTDPSTSYSGWTIASVAPTSGYGFYPTYVTAPRIYEWALKVATPVTVTTDVAAVAAVASGTAGTKVIYITPALTTALTNAKIKLAGLVISQVFTTTAAIGASSLTLNYTGDGIAIPIIPAGTAVCLSTTSAVSSVTVGSTVVPLGTAPPTSAVSEMILTLSAALDSSLVVGSSVLLSGSTITGPITIKSINDGATRVNVTVQWSPAQTVPILPPGLTIESVLDNPIAVPLISSNPGPVYVTAEKAAVASTATGQVYAVNLGTGIPTTTGAIIIPSLFPTTTTFTASALGATSVTLTPNAAVAWPIVPVGTMLFKTSDGTPVTVATAPSLYNKVGTLNGQKMYNWQIAQTVGPGTYWFSGSTNQIVWGGV
jgi:hypothetical protein